MESSARSIERAQTPGIVLFPTLLSSCGYFPTATKIESQPRAQATEQQAATATGVGSKANPSDSSCCSKEEL